MSSPQISASGITAPPPTATTLSPQSPASCKTPTPLLESDKTTRKAVSRSLSVERFLKEDDGVQEKAKAFYEKRRKKQEQRRIRQEKATIEELFKEHVITDIVANKAYADFRVLRRDYYNKHCAIKVLPKRHPVKPMRNLLKDLSTVEYSSLVSLIDFKEDRDNFYLLLEDVQSVDIRKALASPEPGRISLEKLRHALRQLLKGIQHINSAGFVIFREIDVDNLLYVVDDRRSTIKLCLFDEFGPLVAKASSSSDERRALLPKEVYVTPQNNTLIMAGKIFAALISGKECTYPEELSLEDLYEHTHAAVLDSEIHGRVKKHKRICEALLDVIDSLFARTPSISDLLRMPFFSLSSPSSYGSWPLSKH
ncbi:MAG: protein kinase family protein [Waddliaceae bacterium]|jgi:serine/threonine protein kinase|nr:protein kinase family protein [Waddliaceae bacterium]MBT3579533.1 protein kinase family protein [Waddliaceae bacterium]MBT4444416.1 protein kinase family protein [Waddliaceae bacterium]MBT6928646.1 protein kinase family protein [Waddliaceae bacterium]MBT7265184.1 protein kinase family protein [Waddliaceae bacterium]